MEQSKIMTSMEAKQTVKLHTNRWQKLLKKLGCLIVTSLVAPFSLAKAVSEIFQTAERVAPGGKSGGQASNAFDFWNSIEEMTSKQ